MKRNFKLIVVLFVLLVAATATVSAQSKGSLRIGLEYLMGENNLSSAVLIIRPAPFDFKVGYNFTEGSRWIYLSGDYRIVSGYQLVDALHLFLAAGAYFQFGEPEFNAGLHIPLGIQLFLIDNVLELFAEWTPSVLLAPTISLEPWRGGIGFTVLIPKFWKK